MGKKKIRKKISRLEVVNAALGEQVKDLDERLTNILKLDTIAMNQELIGFKNKLAEAVELTHADYRALLEVPMSQDSYDFSLVTLAHLFKILKRFDIKIEGRQAT